MRGLAATQSALWLMARVLVPAEQRQLARTFGGGCRDGAGSVRRWL